MFSKLPVILNRFYNKTSENQSLYDNYNKTITKGPQYFQEAVIFRCLVVIYEDYYKNGFGSDWNTEFKMLLNSLESINDLSYLIETLKPLEDYSHGYKLPDDHVKIAEIGILLEDSINEVLEYIDTNIPWSKLQEPIEV